VSRRVSGGCRVLKAFAVAKNSNQASIVWWKTPRI
jgi:hypothetical protein